MLARVARHAGGGLINAEATHQIDAQRLGQIVDLAQRRIVHWHATLRFGRWFRWHWRRRAGAVSDLLPRQRDQQPPVRWVELVDGDGLNGAWCGGFQRFQTESARKELAQVPFSEADGQMVSARKSKSVRASGRSVCAPADKAIPWPHAVRLLCELRAGAAQSPRASLGTLPHRRDGYRPRSMGADVGHRCRMPFGWITTTEFSLSSPWASTSQRLAGGTPWGVPSNTRS